MASPYASAAKIASAEANLGGPIALDSSLLLKQLVVALGNVTGGGGGGSGTVTSIAQSFTGGLISVAGSPITTSGTLALTVAGTSGGIPYFSSTSTWASSAALAANALVVGGGAGAAPSTVTTGTGVVTALGVNVGTAGAFVVNGGALGTPSSGTLTNCTGIPAAGITGTLPAANGGTGVANGASCSLTLPDAATTITTGGTIALGGFTLTVPATGTAALRGTTNSFTAVNTFAPTTPGSAVVITSGTVTTSLPFLTATQTWNAAQVFTAASITVTATSFSTGSKFLTLTAAASLQGSFDFDVAGQMLIGSSGNAGVRGAGAGVHGSNGGSLHFGCIGSGVAYLGNTQNFGASCRIEDAGCKLLSTGAFMFSSDSTSYGTADTGIKRGSAGVLKVTNGSTGYGAVDASSFKVSGTAGATGGTFTAITSITVTNGIITAISGT